MSILGTNTTHVHNILNDYFHGKTINNVYFHCPGTVNNSHIFLTGFWKLFVI